MKFSTPTFLIKTAVLLCISACLFACKGKPDDAADEDAAVKSQTPVTVTTIADSSLANYINLNATSTYLQKKLFKGKRQRLHPKKQCAARPICNQRATTVYHKDRKSVV